MTNFLLGEPNFILKIQRIVLELIILIIFQLGHFLNASQPLLTILDVLFPSLIIVCRFNQCIIISFHNTINKIHIIRLSLQEITWLTRTLIFWWSCALFSSSKVQIFRNMSQNCRPFSRHFWRAVSRSLGCRDCRRRSIWFSFCLRRILSS